MIHLKARRLLPDLVDQTLSDKIAIEVGVHVASCARCRRLKREYEISAQLIGQMPLRLGPLDFDPRSYARLRSMSRWSRDRKRTRPTGYRVPVLALASAGVIVLLAVTADHWSPALRGSTQPMGMENYAVEGRFVPEPWLTGRF